MEKIYKKEIVSDSASIRMMRVLSRNFWDSHAISAIPPTTQVFSKNGAVNASRSEVLLVNVPRRPYVFCITTKNNKDESWSAGNEAWQLIEKISALLWNHYK
jgi:beta-lactamase class A